MILTRRPGRRTAPDAGSSFIAASVRDASLAEAAVRWGPVVTGLVPAPLRSALARRHRPLARHIAAQRYRHRYGAPFLAAIDDADDLLHYSLDVAADRPALRYYHAVRMYFQGGEWNAHEVDKLLAEHGHPLRDAGSVLEFASGWGRVTRHLVHYVDPARVTVSDIDRGAVDFVSRELGVRGFYSASTPEELVHDARYAVIVAVSFFSHVPRGQWGPWLRRLGELLEPGGVLLFSTLGMHAWSVNVSEEQRSSFETVEDGFSFSGTNETRGRLGAEHYGTAYVDEGYVRRAAAEHFAGRLVASCPRALNGFQDVYLLQRGS